MILERTINLTNLLQKKSHFLFGARGTGKSFLIRNTIGKECGVFVVNLLLSDMFQRFLRRPGELSEVVPEDTHTVVIDEIQKIPALLDEVHHLIEERGLRFLLTGSSARKLKRGAANLLGGRAWEARLFPFTSHELGEHFDLGRYLSFGGLPSVYFSPHPDEELRNYTAMYLKEEIQAEALVKRLDHFVRFLDCAALANGEELNFEGIASDSGVPARTVASYFEILEDTLLGFQVPAFTRTKKRKAIKRSRFYLFDVGVLGSYVKRGVVQPGSELFGRALEHFIAQELRAYLAYTNSIHQLHYWRSTSQQEVDFVVPDTVAIEVKSSSHVSPAMLKGLNAFAEERQSPRSILVSMDPIPRVSSGVEVMPVQLFLKRLWGGEIIGS